MGGYGPTLLTVSWVEFAICTALIIARVYTAWVVTRRVKLDLYLTLLTYVCLFDSLFSACDGGCLASPSSKQISISCANRSNDYYHVVDGVAQRGFSDYEHCVRAGPAYSDSISRANRPGYSMELGKSNSCYFCHCIWEAGNCGFSPSTSYDTSPWTNDIFMDSGRQQSCDQYHNCRLYPGAMFSSEQVMGRQYSGDLRWASP